VSHLCTDSTPTDSRLLAPRWWPVTGLYDGVDMHNHNIALALADARVAELHRATTYSTATVPPRRHFRALALLALAATAALAALAPTGALARPPQDTATPADQRALAETSSLADTTARQDMRSADARDAARTAQPRQDVRSPDARDAAEGRGTYNSPDVVIVKVPQPSPATAPEPSSAGGIDWTAAGIGAGSLLGLSLMGLGGGLLIVHRRRAAHGAPPVAGL
jgi:hypothetical protein